MTRIVLIWLSATALLFGCAGTHPVPWISTPQFDLEYDLAWDLTVGLFHEQYELETADKESGVLVTKWKPLDSSGTEAADSDAMDQLGVRVTCRVEGRFPFQLKLKVEKGVLLGTDWTPVWVEYCRESICQRCEAGRDWVDEQVEQQILKDLSLRLQN